MTGVAPASKESIRDALDEVLDPCSIAAGHPLGLDEMGLVRELEVAADGSVSIVLRPTFPGCLMMPMLAGAAEERALQVPGVRTVRVDLDIAMTWTPSEMRPRDKTTPMPPARVLVPLGPTGGPVREAGI